jgi:hypothetical protein
MAIPDQGLQAGDYRAIVRAMVLGATYANIHTSTFQGGEIRGQIRPMRSSRDGVAEEQEPENK